MSKIASSANVSKVASAADVAGLDGSITAEVDGGSSGTQAADVIIGPGGFVHDPREEVSTACRNFVVLHLQAQVERTILPMVDACTIKQPCNSAVLQAGSAWAAVAMQAT
jgi:hypothetical protein